jgi:hypothetical protein
VPIQPIQPIQPIIERLNQIGFERTRRAVSALALSLFMAFYLLLAFVMVQNGMPELVPALVALAVCYGVAFMGVAAEWFWGRWFAAGLGWSGIMLVTVSLVMTGQWNTVLGLYGGLHGLIVLALAGQKMADRYDLQTAWRERFGMDEFGVARLRKTVTRASASLPSVIFWALGPKEPGQGMLLALAGVGAATLAISGLAGVIRLRSWGLLALAGAAVVLFSMGGIAGAALSVRAVAGGMTGLPTMGLGTLAAGGLLLASVLPFAGPLARHLGRRASR